MHDLVIRNGKIVDGSGKKAFIGDIAIDKDRISKVGLVEEQGKEEIDAESLVGSLVNKCRIAIRLKLLKFSEII